ncbi:hypothetical protein ACHAW5_007802 [Stephanodiscus triporus]|uniref:Uncharacterized protein n=1 Tax=Stephanodiscus triporus TaxID=2934178 RepID=A0ABD3MG63_9STRA
MMKVFHERIMQRRRILGETKPSTSWMIPVLVASANSNDLTTLAPFNVTPPSSTFKARYTLDERDYEHKVT